jgi:Zn-dependent M28 family amino/carboxypeptidase
MRTERAIAAVLAAASLSACVEVGGPAKLSPKVTVERAEAEIVYPGHGETSPKIAEADLRSRIAALADDRFEGRLPGAVAGEASADWIADEMRRMGFKPGNGGSYFQDVATASTLLDPEKSTFEIATPNGPIVPKFGDDIAYWTPRFDKAEQRVTGSDLIFVGYGADAPEHNWNDFAGVDVRGKTIVVLINDPGFVTKDDTLFKGRAMTYYGRWTYKFEEAARKGAAAVIIVHETEPASYGWQVVRNSNTGDKLFLDAANGNADRVTIQSWITEDTAKSLFAAAGLDYAALRIAANKRGFKAVPMTGLTLNARTVSKVQRFKTRNVLGLIPGRTAPSEAVLLTAHWDHLGIKPNVPGEDKLHNGAVDNATGVAAILEMGEAFAKAKRKPRRSILVAAVTLEEQGLLGSEYLARNPPMPLSKIVGGVNIDAMLPAGRSLDMQVVGSGASELEPILARVLQGQGRSVTPDERPERGSFYRSDHISLAKMGVPMLYAGGGFNRRQGGQAAGLAAAEDYSKNRYHQPADEYAAAWEMSGPVEDVQALFGVAEAVANTRRWPNWYPGNEFRAIRDKSLGASAQAVPPRSKAWKKPHRGKLRGKGARGRK